MREIKDKILQKKVVNAGCDLNHSSFIHYCEEIRLSKVDALRCMTTTLVESMNFVFKAIGNLPITAMVRATYFWLGSLFSISGEKWSLVLQLGYYSMKAARK